MMDDGSAFSLISLFRYGDVAGLDLGLADMGIKSLMLVVDGNFMVELGLWLV